MDEATQFTEEEFRYMGGCLRGANDIPKQFFLTCNPGGVGHRWVKRLFIDQEYKSDSTNPEENEDPSDYYFIQAKVDDNIALMNSKDGEAYKRMLSSLPENIRAAHRDGDWDVLSGSYFPEFSVGKHVVQPFAIPKHWTRYRAFDYGLDMLAVLWVAVDEQGRAYVYRELRQSNQNVSEASRLILENTGRDERISVTFAPPDMWNRQKDSGKSMAELYMTSGVPIVKANNNRVQGWLQVKEFLMDGADGQPGLVVFSTCKGLISDMQAIQADENNPNDCAKQPHDITHGPDSLRYFCISRTLPGERPVDPVYKDEFDDDDLEDEMTGGEVSVGYINA
jgi:phage terminase large subunit